MPLFDARLWSALDATKAEREIVLVQYEKAIQSAFHEVADALAVQGTVGRQLAAPASPGGGGRADPPAFKSAV